jgi:hypothetical protein
MDEYNNKNNKDEAPNPSNEIFFDFGTAFSSDLIKIKEKNGDEKLYSRGGLILIKINSEDLNKKEDLTFDFNLEYQSFDGHRSSQNYSYNIDIKNRESEFFNDNNIRKGISIYYFTNVLNYIVETSPKGNYSNQNENKDENKKRKDLKLLETKQVVREYLNNNFILEPDNQNTKNNFENYIKLIEDRYSEYKKVVFSFYNLDAAPLVY